MKRATVFALSAVIAGIFMISCNSKTEIKMDPQMGDQLVKELWDNLAANNTEAINVSTADGFQAVHEDGAITKDAELELISGLAIDSYTIDNLISTQTDNVIVTTYVVSVEETIEGERLSKKPAARMSVFVNKDGKWLWLAHANLKPLEDAIPEIPVSDTTAPVEETGK